MDFTGALKVLFGQRIAIEKAQVEAWQQGQQSTIGGNSYQLEEYKNQLAILETDITDLKNKEILHLKQIASLLQDKEELKEEVRKHIDELKIKESELSRKAEEIRELARYKENAAPLTDQVIVKGLTNIGNQLIGYMAKVQKTYSAKELQDKLGLSKQAIWKHLHQLENEEYIEITGTTRAKYIILTGKHKKPVM